MNTYMVSMTSNNYTEVTTYSDKESAESYVAHVSLGHEAAEIKLLRRLLSPGGTPTDTWLEVSHFE